MAPLIISFGFLQLELILPVAAMPESGVKGASKYNLLSYLLTSCVILMANRANDWLITTQGCLDLDLW